MVRSTLGSVKWILLLALSTGFGPVLRASQSEAERERWRIAEAEYEQRQIAWLLAQLKKGGSSRSDAATELAKYKDPRVVEALISTLMNDESGYVRGSAADSLGTIGDPSAVEPLIAALRDPAGPRAAAVRALTKLKDARAVEALSFALKDRDAVVRHLSAVALGAIGDPRGVDPLIGALGDCGDPTVAALLDYPQPLCARAARALGEIRDPRSIEALLKVAKRERNSLVRDAAINALERMKDLDPRAAKVVAERDQRLAKMWKKLGKGGASKLCAPCAEDQDCDADELACGLFDVVTPRGSPSGSKTRRCGWRARATICRE